MKKTRLLEIIREEISTAINEIPYIGGQYDISYDEKENTIEKGILQTAINDAIKAIQDSGMTDPTQITKLIVSKKARQRPDLPTNVKDKLISIDDAILKQALTFDDPKVLKIVRDLANQPKSDINVDMEPFISGNKTFSDKLQSPQTSKAVAKYGNIEEMAFSLVKGEEPSEKLEPRYKKEKFKKVVDTILSKVNDKKTMADIARELGVIQQKIRPVVSALLDVGILQKGETESKSDSNKPKKEKSTGSEPKAAKADKADSDDEAPSGDVEMEKAARSTDALIKQYQNVMDTYKKKKSEDGDKEALEYLKTKQDIVKKYKKAKSL